MGGYLVTHTHTHNTRAGVHLHKRLLLNLLDASHRQQRTECLCSAAVCGSQSDSMYLRDKRPQVTSFSDDHNIAVVDSAGGDHVAW